MATAEKKRTKQKTPAWCRAFLAMLSETGNISDACRKARIDRSAAYKRRAADQSFAEKWDDALDAAADVLEAEARRRAHDGVLEPVFYQGYEVGQVRRYSDTLLIFLLKGARPEKFRERYEVGGGDKPIVVRVVREDG